MFYIVDFIFCLLSFLFSQFNNSRILVLYFFLCLIVSFPVFLDCLIVHLLNFLLIECIWVHFKFVRNFCNFFTEVYSSLLKDLITAFFWIKFIESFIDLLNLS